MSLLNLEEGKTFNGYGPVKNHGKHWCPRKNKDLPIALKKFPFSKSYDEVDYDDDTR